MDNSAENWREGKWKSSTVSKSIRNKSCFRQVHICTAKGVRLSSVMKELFSICSADLCPYMIGSIDILLFSLILRYWEHCDVSWMEALSKIIADRALYWHSASLSLNKDSLFLKKIFYVYECFIPTGMYCNTSLPAAFRDKKRRPNALDLELWTVDTIMWVLKIELGFYATSVSIQVGEPSLQPTLLLYWPMSKGVHVHCIRITNYRLPNKRKL